MTIKNNKPTMSLAMTVLNMAAVLFLSCLSAHAFDANAAFARVGGVVSLQADNASAIPAAKSRVSASDAQKTGKKTAEWTVIAFLNSKNNLEEDIFNNLNQMEIAGSTDKVNILAEIGRMKNNPDSDGTDADWTGVRRYYVQKDYFPTAQDAAGRQQQLQDAMSKVNSKMLMDLGDVDMGDYKEVVKFAQWAKKNYPAKKYLLLLSDHGSGWVDPKPHKPVGTKAISFDDETGHYIATLDIAKIVREIGGADVMVYDACLMQMAEIGYELRGQTKFILGSEETFPGPGIDYSSFFGALVKAPQASPEEAANLGFNAVKQQYSDGQNPLTISVVDVSQFGNFVRALENWSAVALKTAGQNAAALKYARDNVLRFEEFSFDSAQRSLSTYADVYEFVRLATEHADANSPLKQAGENMMASICGQGNLVVNHFGIGTDSGRDYSLARGISMTVPRAVSYITESDLEDKVLANKYADFGFVKATPKWQAFSVWMDKNLTATLPKENK